MCSCSSGRAAALAALYDGYDVTGLQYGPGYRTLVQACAGEAKAAARLRARSMHEGTAVHPADLDDVLCVGALSSGGSGGGETRVPFAVDDAQLQGAGGHMSAVRSQSFQIHACNDEAV